MSDISSVSNTSGVTSLYTNSDRSTIDQNEFMSILIQELQSQDPMDPMSNAELAAQIASIQSLQSNSEMSEAIEGLVRQQSINSGADLIGKYITAADGSGGDDVSGFVESVAVDSTGVYLKIGDVFVPQGNIYEVRLDDPNATEEVE